MKQRFSYLDLRLINNEVAHELGECRLQNIYALEASSRHFMFKFDAKDGHGKRFLIVDPGFRMHLTKFQHETSQMPPQFVSKLRKHLKTRRASKFWVAHGSRSLAISFSEGQYYLVFEFFSGGNIILLDNNKKILTLFRVVKGANVQHPCAVGEVYTLPEDAQEVQNSSPADTSIQTLEGYINGSSDRLGKILYTHFSDPSSSMLEYCLRKHGLDPKSKEVGSVTDLKAAIDEAINWAYRLIGNSINKGYILKNKEKQESLEFEPFAEYFQQEIDRENSHELYEIVDYPTYNETVDAYFGAILENRQASKLDQLHNVAEARLQAARSEKENRLKGLDQVEQHNELCGKALQHSHELADAAVSSVKALVDQGMDWGDVEQLIKLEQDKGNAVALVVSKLDLANSKVSLKLPNPDFVDDDEDKDTPATITVVVRIDQSAYSSARDYFDIKRAASAKKEKTALHAQKALKSAEQKIQRDLEKNLAKSTAQSRQLHTIRQPYWFEKFYWFLCSDAASTLVVAGRDEMQNELLLRRYFDTGDLLVHSDAPGSSLLIIKNPSGRDPTPQALSQSSMFCSVSNAKAWDASRSINTYYLTRAQVPRLTEDGDPISVRDLAHVPKRISLPPTPLDMGLAILWQVVTNGGEDLDSDAEVGDASSTKPDDDSDEEDFPDTQFDTDEEFPDTAIDSDVEPPVEDSEESDLGEKADVVEDSSAEHAAREPRAEAVDEAPVASQPEPTTASPEATVSHEDESSPSEDEGSDERASSQDPSSAKGSLPKKVRGGKKKMRKYMEQDEEDRKAAMERLGTLKGLERQAQEREEREEAKRQYAENQRLRKERARKAELARIANESTEPTPYPSDLRWTFSAKEKVVAAVPMFGPWPALRAAQHKIKMTPGSLKKGKAVTESMRVILGPEATDGQKLMLEAVKPTVVQGVIPVSHVQLGLGAFKAASKQAAKGGKGAKQGGSKGGSKGSKGSKGKR